MSEKINMEEILKKELIPAIAANNPDLTFNATIRAMKEACSQILKLAAENAKTYTETYCSPYKEEWDKIVDKQSILDTIKQVE